MLPFDPIDVRNFWLEVQLPYILNDEPRVYDQAPAGVTHISHTSYSLMRTSAFVSGYLVGLSKELGPMVEKHATWMESEPEPDRAVYAERGFSKEGWLEALCDWRQALGVCKWLGRGDRAFASLTAAAAANWQMLELASPALRSDVRTTRRNDMANHLATALAADVPLLGLKSFDAAGMKLPMASATSPVRFGHWACRHLVNGGTRDETFVSRGRDMLTATLLPTLSQGGAMIELALWIKATYFDSGVARTPEQTIARAYDSMPGIPRPDFILP